MGCGQRRRRARWRRGETSLRGLDDECEILREKRAVEEAEGEEDQARVGAVALLLRVLPMSKRKVAAVADLAVASC